MLTLEAPQFHIRGLTIFRDFSNPRQFYYLPSEKARVSENGKGLAFVVYTEDITGDPNFNVSDDRAGGFLTLEVELGPTEAEVLQVQSELESRAGVGGVILTQVPFTDGTVTLYLLSQTGQVATGAPKHFEVSVAGSTKPSLFGRQSAVFSVRLGGKAANVLWETLRTNADPQAVVTYDLQFLAVQPSYNLEVEIDFKETFSFMRHRIGVNLLVASADIDLMTQELMNTGTITVREVDFSGKGNANSPVAGEGGILKLVRDLMAPSLFTTVPIPTPDYRALPDSATKALETAGGTKQILSTGSGTTGTRTPVTAGTDLKVTHTPPGGGQTPGGAVDITANVEPASGVTIASVKMLFRVQGQAGDFQELEMTRGVAGATGPTSPPGPTGATAPPGPTGAPGPTGPIVGGPSGPSGPGGPSGPTGAPAPVGGTGPSGATGPIIPGPIIPGGPGGGGAPVGDVPADAPSFTRRFDGRPSGTTIEYFIRATGTKAGVAVTQNLPQDGQTAPLSMTFGASQGGNSTQFKVPQTDGPLVGYSLRSIEGSQQIKRKFTLNKAEAVTQRYHPSGALSANGIGPDYDPKKQITRVALGQGPFKVIVIKIQAGFDFDTHHVQAAKVHIEYGRNAAKTGPLHALTVSLTKTQPAGQVQFFADEDGTQSYSYFVEFTYDPDRVVGTTPGQALRSQTFTGVTERAITVDLDVHSPLIPVKVEAGVLSFDNGVVRQVQVRIAPSATGEGRTIQLARDRATDSVLVVPANPAKREYHMQQKFFFKDGSTTIEHPSTTDTNIVVNEPGDLVFKMVPQYVDTTNLVKEVLVDAVYTHKNGDKEQSTLHLNPQTPRSEFAILLRPNDPREWDATFRFAMTQGEPLESTSQHLRIAEPLVTLNKSGFRIVTVALLDETAFSADPTLLGIKVVLGRNVADATLPTTSVLLRANRLTGSVVVPGVTADGPVSVAVEVLRRGQPAQRTTSTLSPSERELYV